MTKVFKAYDKIDNTICLNANDGNIKFGIDTYGDGPDGDPCDCKDIYEACQSLDTILTELKLSKKNKKILRVLKKVCSIDPTRCSQKDWTFLQKEGLI